MTITTCPNCGKPLRPGTRFCGSCGAPVPDDRQKTSETQPDEVHWLACPNCGKPVRPGAKFCSHCGKEISLEPPKAVTPPNGPGLPPPVSQPGVKPPSSGGVPQQSVPSNRSRRKPVYPLLIIGLLLLCGLGAVGGFVYFKDPFGWQKNTPVVELLTPPPTLNLLPTVTEMTPVVVVQETQVPTPTTFVIPVSSPTPESPASLSLITPTIAPLLIQPITSTLMVTSTTPLAPLSTPVVLLEDDFNGTLSTNWKTWGEPRASIQNGPDEKWLDLKAADKPGRAGVTSRIEIENSPGTQIEFNVQLNSTYPLFPLILDWDPDQFDRGPDNSALTIAHFELQKASVLFQAPAENKRCKIDLNGLAIHDFVIKFVAENKMELFIDHSPDPNCTLEMGVNPAPGRISFTGTGWVTRVLITRSQAQ